MHVLLAFDILLNGLDRENCMVDRCVRKDSSGCDSSRIIRLKVEGDVTGVTTRGVRPHAPVNHSFLFMPWFY